jgi:hypothetical protein
MATAPTATPDTSAELLSFVREQRAVADRAEANILAGALDWAAFHSEDSLVPAVDHWEQALPLAGEGTPEVAEFCIAEFAAVLGLSTDAGRTLIGDALELAHRLPRVWARVQAGTLAAWRARKIAQATRCLPPAGAGFVDQHVVAFAHRISFAALDRLIEEAKVRFDPEQARADRQRAADGRRFDIHLGQVSYNGTVDVTATLDLKDAHDLNTAIARRAGFLGQLGGDLGLDLRRSLAAGEIARADLTLDLETGERSGSNGGAGIELRVHVSAVDLTAAMTGATAGADGADGADAIGLARVERTRSFIDLDQLRTWLARPGARISVRGVIDTAANLRSDRYEIPERIRDQVDERDGFCRFPHCNRAHTDLDHIEAYDPNGPPGQTTSGNLARLCRRHHRLKTFGNWAYTQIEPGTFLWRSPHGHRWLVTPSGTQSL